MSALQLSLYICCAATAAHACSVPVFRYALDHWKADRYRLELAAVAVNDPALSVFFRNFGDSSPVNLEVVSSANTPQQSRLLFPHDEAIVWSGALDAAAYLEVTQSPARSELVKRLLSGESGVWIFLDSGQAGLDASEAARLEKRLAFLETVASLPSIDPSDPSNRLGPGPELRVSFSVLRVAFNDARESVLRTMLSGPHGEKPSVSDGPMAALVFGRGRALGAWTMKDLIDEAIDEACLFLLGACSCQVKNLNPGWDLLLSVDWDDALMSIAAQPSSDSNETDAGIPPAMTAPETVVIEPTTHPPTVEPEGWFTSRRVVFGFGGAGMLAALAVLLTRYRFPGKPSR